MDNNEEIKAAALCETKPAKKGKSLLQLIKFCLVGASNSIVDMVVNVLLAHLLGLFFTGNWIVFLSKAVGYCCGILNSYCLNSRWTFKEEHRKGFQEILGFLAVNCAVFAVWLGLYNLFIKVLGLDRFWAGLVLPQFIKTIVTPELFCSLLSTCVCMPIGFILNKLFVFKPKGEEEINDAGEAE